MAAAGRGTWLHMPLPPPGPDAHVLVTGASSGIGAAVARSLSSRGYPVVLVARRAEVLAELARELGGELDGARTLAADLADDAERARVREVVLADERIVGVVNAAGYGLTGRVADIAGRPGGAEDLDQLVRLDVLALHDLTVAAVTALMDRGGGAVLNVSSITAYQPLPGVASYAAAKAFVQSFSEAVHAELAGSGVSLTTVSPGLTRTGFADAAGTEAFDRAPAFTVGDAEDVAEAAVEAMAAGRRTVVPGWVNQLSAFGGRHVPRSLLLPVVNSFG